MALRAKTCLFVVCDGCGADNDTGDFIPHYDTAVEAEANLREQDWRVERTDTDTDTRHLCPDCAERESAP